MRITWIRAGDRYPDLKHDLDNFIALDGETEIGVVKCPAGMNRNSQSIRAGAFSTLRRHRARRDR